MQNLVVVSRTVCWHVDPKILGDAGAPPPLDSGVARNTLHVLLDQLSSLSIPLNGDVADAPALPV